MLQIQKDEKNDLSLWEKETVLDAMQKLKDSISVEEYEKMRDKAFMFASIGEEAGFVMGFTYAVRLFTQCL